MSRLSVTRTQVRRASLVLRRCLAGLVVALALSSAGWCDDVGTWTAVPAGRSYPELMEQEVVAFHGRLYMVGGLWTGLAPAAPAMAPEAASDQAALSPERILDWKDYIYSSADGTTWTAVAHPLAWGKRYGHAVVVFRDLMWVIGGHSPYSSDLLNDVWCSYDAVHWTEVTAAAQWGPRMNHGVTVHAGRLWLTGGFTSGNGQNPSSEVWSSTDGKDWVLETAAPAWTPRGEHLFYGALGRMWLFGGNNSDFIDASPMDAFQSGDGRDWALVTQDPLLPPLGSIGAAGAFFRQRLWVMGGERNTIAGTVRNNDVLHSIDGQQWFRNSATPWPARSDHRGVVYDDRFWIVGGSAAGDWRMDIPDPLGWQRFGFPGGTVQDLTIHGRDLLAATNNGIYACDLNLAASSAVVWRPLGPLGRSIYRVCADPANPSALYAAVFVAAPGGDEASFFRTTSNGPPWIQSDTGIHGLCLWDLAGAPATDGATSPTLFVGAYGVLARSRDGARSWQAVHAAPNWSYYSVACDPTSASVVWAGGYDATIHPFLLRSADGGDTWTDLLAGDSAMSAGVGITCIAFDRDLPGVVRAYGVGLLWETTDGGLTRTVRPTELSITWNEVADPADANHLYAAGRLGLEDVFGFSESADRGAHWTIPDHAREGTSEILALAFDPLTTGTFFAGTRGTGVLRRGGVEPPTTATLRLLTTTTSAGGSVSRWPQRAYYADGTTVTLFAQPDAHYRFVAWSGDLPSPGAATQPSFVLTMDRDRALHADFAPESYTLATSGVGGGSVLRQPDQASYVWPTSVTLTAVPDVGHHFANWTGDVPVGKDAMNPLTLLMDGTKSLVAHFLPNQYAVTVQTVGNGTAAKSPDLALYYYGTTVTLTATPLAGQHFAGWTGDVPAGRGQENPLTLVVQQTLDITANFAPNRYAILLRTQGVGTAAKAPDQALYDYGTDVALTATPAFAQRFAGWTGDVPIGHKNDNPLHVTVDTTLTLTAVFLQNMFPLSVNVTAARYGSVTRAPDQALYLEGSAVTVTATPENGYRFVGWSGDVPAGATKTNPLRVVVTTTRTLVASFYVKWGQYRIVYNHRPILPGSPMLTDDGLVIGPGAPTDTLKISLPKRHTWAPPMPRVASASGFKQFYSGVDIDRLEVAGAIVSLSTRAATVGRIEAELLMSVRMDSAITSGPATTSIVTSAASPLSTLRRLSLKGIVLESLDTEQSVKALSATSKVRREPATGVRRLSLGGIGRVTPAAQAAWPAGSYEVVAAGLGSVKVTGGDFAPDLAWMSAGPISQLSATQLSLGPVVLGGFVGRQSDWSRLRVIAPDIGRVTGSAGVHGIFIAGGDAGGQPTYTGSIASIATRKGGALSGEACVLKDKIRFVPPAGVPSNAFTVYTAAAPKQ